MKTIENLENMLRALEESLNFRNVFECGSDRRNNAPFNQFRSRALKKEGIAPTRPVGIKNVEWWSSSSTERVNSRHEGNLNGDLCSHVEEQKHQENLEEWSGGASLSRGNAKYCGRGG